MNKRVFINKNFFLLWLGEIISQLGDKFYAIALSWWILQKTNSSEMMGVFLTVSVLPALIFGFFAGVWVDKSDCKKVLVIADFIRGALVMLTAVLSVLGYLQVWQVFLVGAVISLTTAFFDPAMQSIIPQLVEKDNLAKANSMIQIVNGICTVLGPMLGATSVSLIGYGTVFLINAVSYILSAVLKIKITLGVKEKSGFEATNKIWVDLKAGLYFLKSKKEIIRIIIIIALAHFFLGGLMVIIPFLAEELKGGSVHNLGKLQTTLGLGLLSGAFGIRIRKNDMAKERQLVKLMAGIGVCFLGVGAALLSGLKITAPYLVFLLLIGAAMACASIYWETLIQTNTPGYIRGRVFSVSTLAANVSLPVAYGIYGILLTHNSIMKLMLINGSSLILLCGVLALISNMPRARE